MDRFIYRVGKAFAPTLLAALFAAAPARADILYVANTSSNTIEKFTSGGVGSVFAISGDPQAIAFDSAGNLYVANSGISSMDKITPSGIHSIFVDVPGPGSAASLAFDSAGNLYATYIRGGAG